MDKSCNLLKLCRYLLAQILVSCRKLRILPRLKLQQGFMNEALWSGDCLVMVELDPQEPTLNDRPDPYFVCLLHAAGYHFV